MKGMVKMRRALTLSWLLAVVVGLLLVALLPGCRGRATAIAPAPLAVGPPAAVAPAQGQTFVEFANPQSDDQGHYVPFPDSGTRPVMGFVASPRKIVRVTVNDAPAVIYPATYTPLGAPAGLYCVGYRVPLYCEPETALSVAVFQEGGVSFSYLARPNRALAYTRLRELRTRYPTNPYLRLRLGNAYACEADYVRAYPEYQAVVLALPGFTLGYYFYGQAAYYHRDYDESIFAFRRCLSLEPSFVIGYQSLGDTFFLRASFGEADACYRRVIAAYPDYCEPYWRRGQIFTRRGDWAHADEQYQLALRYDPRFADARYGLGEVRWKQGQGDQARREFEQALKLNAHYAPAHFAIGQIYAQQGNWPEASRHYQEAVRFAPHSSGSRLALAEALQKQGKSADAQQETRQGNERATAMSQQHRTGHEAMLRAKPTVHQQAAKAGSGGGGGGVGQGQNGGRTDGGGGTQSATTGKTGSEGHASGGSGGGQPQDHAGGAGNQGDSTSHGSRGNVRGH
jgi:tetratricopeptide (TPR) repeat protein